MGSSSISMYGCQSWRSATARVPVHSSDSVQGSLLRPRTTSDSRIWAAIGRRKSSGCFMRLATPARASAEAISASAVNPAPRSWGTKSTDSRCSVACLR